MHHTSITPRLSKARFRPVSGDQQFLGSAPVPWTSRLRARSGVGVGAVASPHMATLSSSLAPSRTCHVVRRRHHGKSSPGMAGARPCSPAGGMIARCMRPAQHSRTPQAGIALLVLGLAGQRRGSPARAAARRSGDQAHCGSSTSSAAQPGVVLLSCVTLWVAVPASMLVRQTGKRAWSGSRCRV